MADAWFSPEIAQNLRWLSLLSLTSLLVIPAKRGRHRGMIMTVWMGLIGFGVVCLSGLIVGLVLGQPGFVLRSLLVLGAVLTAVFGATLRPMRDEYTEAEARKTIAQDI